MSNPPEQRPAYRRPITVEIPVTWTPEQHNGFPDTEVVMCEVNSLKDGAFNLAPGYSA